MQLANAPSPTRGNQSRGRTGAGRRPQRQSPLCDYQHETESQWIYEQVYCQRGDIENRIEELHGLEIDRTSCTSFWANQFRVVLTPRLTT